MSFAHLHVHSYYSLLDGLNSPEELVDAAVAAGQPAIALTDHGSLAGHRELYRAAKDAGIKPIYGVEAYISVTDRFDKRTNKKRDDDTDIYNHIILLAKNQQGVENINKMNEIAWTEGYYYKPRIDTDLLEEYSDGVIVLTGCLNGIPAKLLDRGMKDEAEQWLARLHRTFGDDLYVEVQAHNPEEINIALTSVADKLGIKCVATSDCHRAYEHDKDLQDAFLVLSTNPSRDKKEDYESTIGMSLMDRMNTLYPNRKMTFQEWNLFVQSREQIADDFGGLWDESYADSTLEVVDKIEEYEYYEDMDLLPTQFEDPDGELEFRCLSALREGGYSREYYERLDTELGVIKKKNFSPYFLIVEDIVNWSKSQGILVGPGRGSAAGSLVCYLLGITNVDPIEYNLLFARFINEERNDFPDIDLDFERSRRGEVKEYLQDKYGYVASIATYVYFKDKGVIKDAARVLGIPFGRVKKVMKNVEDFDDFVNSKNPKVVKFRNMYPDVTKLARRLQGKIRGAGMHAGGVVVSKDPITKYAPIETKSDPDSSGRIPVVAYDMNEVERIGLIKFDILGLKTLDVISDTVREAGIDYYEDLPKIDLNDDRLIKTLDRAETVGVFQCDTNPYTRLLREMDITSFEDLAASNALIRPGAMNTVGKDYIARSKGEQTVTYPDPSIREILVDTYGTIIYQEQVMQTAVQLGGMSWAQADKLRKIIGKKKDPAEFAAYKQDFMDGATQHISAEKAAKLWHDFEAHAGYSFNRSHAIAYSMMSMWTLWLKLNYPTEYMAAVLKNEDQKLKRTHYMIEIDKMGIELRMPDINESQKSFSKDGPDAIRFGLADMKYVSDKVFAKLDKKRPFKSVDHLQEVADQKYSGISSRTIDSLMKTGALESIGGPTIEEDAMYDYLNVPSFNVPDLPNAPISNVEDFDEDDTFLLAAMVQRVKKGKGWALIDVVDETGDTGFFDDQDTSVVKGKFYYFIVSNNRVVTHIEVDELVEEMNSNEQSALTKFLTSDTMELLGDRTRYIIHAKTRKTRAGNTMADVVAADADGELHGYVVFSRDLPKIKAKIKIGTAVDFKVNPTKRGNDCIKDVRI